MNVQACRSLEKAHKLFKNTTCTNPHQCIDTNLFVCLKDVEQWRHNPDKVDHLRFSQLTRHIELDKKHTTSRTKSKGWH